MTESPEGVTLMTSPSVYKWPRATGLALMLIAVLLFVGRNTMICIAEVGVYLYDDDLVEGGRYLARAKRQESYDRMYWFGLAIQSHQDMWSQLPKNGSNSSYQSQVEHSWLTWALAYDLQAGAFSKIDLSKRWDDPTNAAAFQRRIRSFEIPNRNLPRYEERGYALSHIAGNQEVLKGEKPSLADITDGTANTVLAGTAAGNYEPWGRPGNVRDLTKGINQSKDGFGSPWSTGGAMVLMADGGIRELSNDTSPQVLQALATPNGGERTPGDY